MLQGPIIPFRPKIVQIPIIIHTIPFPMGNCNPRELQDQKGVQGQRLYKVSGSSIRSGFHRWIGALTSQNRYDLRVFGSAVLISNDLLLTAAHNIYDNEHKCEYTGFKFYLAPCGVVEDYFQVQPGGWRFPEEFKTTQDHYTRSQYDYALMKLANKYQRPASALQEEFLPLQIICFECRKDDFQTAELSIFGYPDKESNYEPHDEHSRKIQLNQYGLTKPKSVKAIYPQGRIHYSISTRSGHSGSPIVSENKVVGLHLAGALDGQYFNIGNLITPKIMENLIDWMRELDGSPFIINQKRLCNHISIGIIETAEEMAKNRVKHFKQQGIQSKEASREKDQHGYGQLTIEGILATTELSQHFKISNRKITSIDLKRHINLKWIELQGNGLVSIELPPNIELTRLHLGQNHLTSIDLRQYPMLSQLRICDNELSSIDLSQNKELIYLDLSMNHLQKIDLVSNRRISNLFLFENRMQWATFWATDKINLHLQNQKVRQCKVRFIYLMQNKEVCLRFMFNQTQRYNDRQQKEFTNKYGCLYSFSMTEGV